MSESEIEQIKGYCANISKLTTGPGINLIEVYESFTQVNNQLKKSNLTETVIGNELEQKLTNVANISDQLIECLSQLNTSLEGFCDMQKQNNNM